MQINPQLYAADHAPRSYPRTWFTTSQLFEHVLGQGCSCKTMRIKSAKYEFPLGSELLVLKLLPNTGALLELHTEAKKNKTPKPKNKIALPFGLKLEPKTRSRKKPKLSHGKDMAVSSRNRKTTENVPDILQDMMDSFGNSESSDGVSVSDGGSSIDSSADSDFDDSEGEPTLVNPQQRSEELMTREVLRSHTALHSSEQPEPEVQSSLAAASSRRAKGGSTFCNQSVGMVEISVQKAARLAQCQGCQTKIARDSVRVGYAYSRKKFHSYVHPGCFPSYLQGQNGDIEQSIVFAEKWISENQGFAQLPDIQSMLQVLQGKSVSAMCSERYCHPQQVVYSF